jgi:hypothetical protein
MLGQDGLCPGETNDQLPNYMSVDFDVLVTVHRRHSEGKEPTRCDKVCSFYCLHMFRAPICPSSGVQLVNVFRF